MANRAIKSGRTCKLRVVCPSLGSEGQDTSGPDSSAQQDTRATAKEE